jgi:hypothetical protein
VIAVELLNVRRTLEEQGALSLTLPQAELSAEELDPVLARRRGHTFSTSARTRSRLHSPHPPHRRRVPRKRCGLDSHWAPVPNRG